MIPVAPTWALFGAAVHAPDDPHLAAGAHLRFQPSRRIGLPVTPLFVERLLVRQAIAYADRTDIAWFDEDDQPVSAPFVAVPGKTYRGRLPHPSQGTCSWLEVGAPGASVTVEARITTPRGPAVVARRSQARYVVSAQRIEDIVVRGTGTVEGVRWFDVGASAILASEGRPWRVLSLPVAPAPRYAPTVDALAAAWSRVDAGAPRRQSLLQDPTIAAPALAPVIPSAMEVARLNPLAARMNSALHRLVSDLSDAPFALAEVAPVTGTIKPTATAQARVPLLGRVLQGLSDPGLARFLGMADVDPDVDAAEEGSLVVYHARAGWHLDAAWMGQFAAMLGTSERSIADFVADVPMAAGHPFGAIGSVWPLAALAITTAHIPSDPPASPIVDAADDRGWRGDTPPPDVRRVIGLPVAGLRPASSLALARQAGASWDSLNPLAPHSTNQRLPLVPSVRPIDTAPGQGYLVDRTVGPGSAAYRLAQADWFGRWSPWATPTAPAKPRTPPPAPVIELSYRAADGAGAGSGPLAGTLTISVAVPADDALPPGGHLLAGLELTIDDGGGAPTTTTFALAALPPEAALHPSTAQQPFARLVIHRAQPALAVAEWRWVQVTGRWKDVAAALSPTTAVKVKAVDPRAPAPPTLSTELLYSARPDVMGLARFEASWPSADSTRYRVYFTTEVGALRFLTAAGHPAAHSLAQLAPGAERAGGFRDPSVVAALDYGAFECVSRAPIVPIGGAAGFTHTLSGSLEGLALYKVVAETDHGVVSPFATASLLTVAVPNHGAPSRPLVSVTRRPAVDGVEPPGVLIKVSVPRNRTEVLRWRLRRTITARGDARQWPVVASGTRAPEAAPLDPLGRSFEIVDDHDLRPWTVYHWTVEVQAGPPPGAPSASPVPAGEWSRPAVPARWSLTPPPPPAPTAVTATPVAGAVQLAIALDPSTPPLRGTPRGSYTVEVVRVYGGQRDRVTLAMSAATAGVMTAIDPEPPTYLEPGQPAVPIDTVYAVRIIDPVGRASAFTSTQP